MKARTLVGRGEKGLLSDPESELLLGGRARVVRGQWKQRFNQGCPQNVFPHPPPPGVFFFFSLSSFSFFSRSLVLSPLPMRVMTSHLTAQYVTSTCVTETPT